MRKFFNLLGCVGICLSLWGCGGETGVSPNSYTENYEKESMESLEMDSDDDKGTDPTEQRNDSEVDAEELNGKEVIEESVTESVETTMETTEVTAIQTQPSTEAILSPEDIPAYSGSPYVVINDNIPQFLETDISTTSYEYYSELDGLGRCGTTYACIGTDIMPTEERGSIGSVKPSGWHTVKYDCVDGKYLYNRCHLIGYQLTGENANEKNLITGTRYMNVEGMLPFENMVADYVKETGNHVMYRVTPVFEGKNLLPSGVQIEAMSVEDNGEGVLFNVYCYNVQPEVEINYTTGESTYIGGSESEDTQTTDTEDEASEITTNVTPEAEPDSTLELPSQNGSIIGNKNSKAFHRSSCSRLPKPKNQVLFNSSEEAVAAGYDNPCDYCNP